MSIIRADSIKNRAGDGAPDFPNGITVTGVVTATTLNSVTNNIDVDDFISVGNNIHLGNAGVITATSGNFTGNVSIGGTLTYEDVTNIDSVGIVTARTGVITPNVDADDFISVGSNIHLGNAGVATATSFSGSGASLTNLNASNIASGTVPTARLGSGTANSSTFLRGDSTFATVTSVGGATGADFNDNVLIRFGTGNDFELFFDGTTGKIIGKAGVQGINVATSNVERYQFTDGSFRPLANNTYDLGTSSLRWKDIYTQDLQLSNEAKKDTGGNDVDGTWGDWTLQEGENDIFMINNRSGKKFKINLTEV